MLSLFPTLLSYQQLSPVLIRLTLGAILIFWGYRGLRDASQSGLKKVFDGVEVVVGILLVLGLWTQLAAAFSAIGSIICLVGKVRARAFLSDGINYQLILLVLALSLLVTGPGWWAFDYPL